MTMIAGIGRGHAAEAVVRRACRKPGPAGAPADSRSRGRSSSAPGDRRRRRRRACCVRRPWHHREADVFKSSGGAGGCSLAAHAAVRSSPPRRWRTRRGGILEKNCRRPPSPAGRRPLRPPPLPVGPARRAACAETTALLGAFRSLLTLGLAASSCVCASAVAGTERVLMLHCCV